MTVTLSLFAGAGAQFLDNNGNPLSGGKIYTYQAGTTTPLTTYTTNSGTIAHTNPIVLDAAGRVPSGGEIWLTLGIGYKFVVKTSAEVLIATYDNIPSSAQPPAANDADSIMYEQGYTVTAGSFVIGKMYRIATLGTTDFTLIGAINNVIGTHFIATGVGTGTGTAELSQTVENKLRETVSVKDFGAVGDGVTDDFAALQAAIDYCIDNQRALFVPTGVYSISAPLIVGKFSAGSWLYSSLTIEGEKGTWQDEGALIKSPRIVPTFKDTFAIGIQNGRNVTIKNIVCFGLNTFGIGNGLTAPNYPEMMTNSTFVNNGVRDSRYSPYAGIAIDPFGTSVPADGGYPGMSAYYTTGAAGSSSVILEQVRCKNFTIGVVVTPNGQTQNAEDISFKDCNLSYNKVGLAVCQSQSRDVLWLGGGIAFNLYGVDGNNYGEQTGSSPKIYNANMSGKYLFNVDSRRGSPLVAVGVHAESFASIGFIGVGSVSTKDPAVFIGCGFNFSDFGGIFADHHLLTYAPVQFIGCSVSTNGMTLKSPLRFIHPTAVDTVTFSSCWFGGAVQNEFFIAPVSANDAYPFVNTYLKNCIFQDSSTRGAGGLSNVSDYMTPLQASDMNKHVIPYGAVIRFLGESNLLKFVGGTQNSVSLGSTTVTTGANGTATFTVADGTIVRTGDFIYTSTTTNYQNYAGSTVALASNCIGVVTAVVGNDITISGVPQSIVTGTFALSKKWWPRFHAASTGDITSGSTTIANVTPTAAWADGNAIQGTGIPAGAYVVSGGGTATLTISIAATATTVGVRLFDANIQSLTGTAV